MTAAKRKPAPEPVGGAIPFLKWAGGKRQLLPEILKRTPAVIETYFEPFLGGGAVFFELANQARFKRAVLCDLNEELVVTYKAVQKSVEPLIDRLITMSERHGKDFYYSVRKLDTATLDDVGRAARLIYLNRTCFNGLYRVNSKGGFNVPIGDYTNPEIVNAENLRAASAALASAEILNMDFAHALTKPERGDFVYFDPPYVPVSKTSNFTAFAKGGFKWEDQERLAVYARGLAGRHVPFLLSNADTKSTRELYEAFKVESVDARRNINSKGSKRGNVGELLVSVSKEMF